MRRFYERSRDMYLPVREWGLMRYKRQKTALPTMNMKKERKKKLQHKLRVHWTKKTLSFYCHFFVYKHLSLHKMVQRELKKRKKKEYTSKETK